MPKTTIIMKSFIEEYLQNPAQAIAAARQTATTDNWYDNIDEEMIYEQIASPQFRLYEAMILAPDADELPVSVHVSA
jgi:hypothetical protein